MGRGVMIGTSLLQLKDVGPVSIGIIQLWFENYTQVQINPDQDFPNTIFLGRFCSIHLILSLLLQTPCSF